MSLAETFMAGTGIWSHPTQSCHLDGHKTHYTTNCGRFMWYLLCNLCL